ncbi:MAG TPA: DUF4388 domain-containing protein [Acidobacteriota bacterium]|nr:DUF4388 domain-containing protein [Acidobacteriota bacterium]
MKKESSGSSRDFSYSGDLSENPLPELLFTIGQYRVPGVLTFTHRQSIKKLYIRDSRVIFAKSNLHEDDLGEFLFRCGKISRTDKDRSREKALRSMHKRQGQILVEMKALDQKDLPWAVQSHQQAILWSLFNWFEGQMVFNIGSFVEKEAILLDVTIPRAILDGVRNIQNAKRIISYIGSRGTVLEPAENALLSIEMFEADEKERAILKLVDGKTSLYDLCAKSSHGPHETAKILYGFYVLKLIRPKNEGVRVVSNLMGNKFL